MAAPFIPPEVSPCLPIQPGLVPCLLVWGHRGDVHRGVPVAGMQPVVTLCLPGNGCRNWPDLSEFLAAIGPAINHVFIAPLDT